MPIPTAPPSGFRDFLPDQVAVRMKAIELISKVYRSYGFQPISTSAVEELSVLQGQGGGENEKLIFKIMRRGEALDRAKAAGEELADLGLRFDLTLPLARYYSKHGSALPHPFKAFHIGPVWRAERAQKGRYREFIQCDADIIGSDSWGAEAEILVALLTAFEAMGLSGVTIHLNDRRLVDKALEAAKVPAAKRGAACIVIDKLDKLDRKKVLSELEAEIGAASTAALENTLLAAKADPDHFGALDAALFASLHGIGTTVRASKPAAQVVIDPSLMRGLGYYTGPVFEFRHSSLAGSLGGGGRYDKLTSAFGGQAVPACGGSIGFERLMLVLEEVGQAPGAEPPDAVVTVFSDDLRGRSLEVASALRAKGLDVDVYPGGGKLKHQFKYADQKKARYAVVIGPDEAGRGVMQVKDLKSGEETAMTLDEACAKIAAKA